MKIGKFDLSSFNFMKELYLPVEIYVWITSLLFTYQLAEALYDSNHLSDHDHFCACALQLYRRNLQKLSYLITIPNGVVVGDYTGKYSSFIKLKLDKSNFPILFHTLYLPVEIYVWIYVDFKAVLPVWWCLGNIHIRFLHIPWLV